MKEAPLSTGEVALLLAVAGAVGFPLLPDRGFGPYEALNPQSLFRLWFVLTTVLVAAQVARERLGPRLGTIAAGFAGGFVSSTATIGAFGLAAKAEPARTATASAGGVASSVATLVLYAVLVATVEPRLLWVLAPPLVMGLLAAVACVAFFFRHRPTGELATPAVEGLRLSPTFAFVLAVAVATVVMSGLRTWLGDVGIVSASAAAGLLDAHATTGTVAVLVHEGRLAPAVARLAVLAAFTTNTGTKLVIASLTRHRPYTVRLVLAHLFIAAAVWAGAVLGAMLGGEPLAPVE